MKKYSFIILLLFLSAFVNTAYADNFQFSIQSAYAALAKVEVFSNGKLVFKGTTDKLGRITIKLDNGTYECKIGEKSISITVDGTTGLKAVEVK